MTLESQKQELKIKVRLHIGNISLSNMSCRIFRITYYLLIDVCTRRLLKRFWQSEYHDKPLRLMSDETVLKVEVGLHVAMIACTREFFCRLPQSFVAADRDNTEPKGEGPERAEGSSSQKHCFDFVCNVNNMLCSIHLSGIGCCSCDDYQHQHPGLGRHRRRKTVS